MAYKSPEEKREYNRQWMAANRDKTRAWAKKYKEDNYEAILSWKRAWHAKNAAKVQASKRKRRDEIAAIKVAAGCVDCGYSVHAAALDFDHVDRSTKHVNVARFATLEAAKEEIAKCVVRCANCHRVKTFEERQNNNLKPRCEAA